MLHLLLAVLCVAAGVCALVIYAAGLVIGWQDPRPRTKRPVDRPFDWP